MSLGGLFGKKRNYASEYAGYRPNQPASIFEQYVDETPGLLDAWEEIEGEPQGTQGSYWIPRGASSKSAFGRAHAAEDSALAGGTYQGATGVSPWTGGTRFENFLDLLSGGGGDDTGPGPFAGYTGSNPYYPVMDTQYSAPAGGGLFAPWGEASLDYVPESIWSGAETEPLTGLGYGVEYNAPRLGPITVPAPEAEGGGASGTTTDASGNKWVITPGGQWISADSDYGRALAAKNAAYSQHYDSSGNYVGAEGLSAEEQGVNFAANAHEAMYPGSRAAANLAGYNFLGATSRNKAYTDYKDYQRSIMGLKPGEEFDSGQWGKAFGKMTAEEINEATATAGWSPEE